MRRQSPILAESARFYRLLSIGPSRVSLVGDTVCIEGRSGAPVAEIPVGRLDAIAVDRFWFWNRLTVRTMDGRRHSVGAIDTQSAARVLRAVRHKVARHAAVVGAQLERIDRRLQRRLSGDRYLRHSDSGEFDGLRNALASVLQRCGGLVREHLDQDGQPLSRLAPLVTDEAFQAAREQANELFVSGSIPAVKSAVRGALATGLTDEQAKAIATDEDVTLVLAGAGTGKTTVID